MFYNCLHACARVVLIAGALGIPAAYAASPAPTFPETTLSPLPLVRAVLAKNQGIAAMRAALDAAHAQVESAGALPDPRLSYSMAPDTLGAQDMQFGQSVKLSQTFPWPGTLDLRTNAAKAEVRSTAQDLADLRLRLAAQTRAAYAEWYYVHQALKVNSKNQAVVRRLGKSAEASYASGQASEQGDLQAEVELTRLQNQALELKSRQHSVQAKINALLNRPPRAPLPQPADLPLPRHLPAFATLRSAALDRYPALKSLNAQIDADRAQVNLAHKESWPSFTVMAGYNSMWSQPEMRPMIGVSINIPFGGNHEGKIDAAQAQLSQSRAKLANSRSQLLRQLEQAYAEARQARHTIRLYAGKLLPLTEQNLEAAEADYRNGNGSFLELVTAERQSLRAKLELARARANFFTQIASLNYRTGGALFPHTPASPSQTPLPVDKSANKPDRVKAGPMPHYRRQP